MSDVRLVLPLSYTRPPAEWEMRVAMDEARAILAETEPGPNEYGITRSRPHSGHGKASPRRLARGQGIAFAALAESLAAVLPVLDEYEARVGR
jgi:hypothetical protein